MQVNINEIMSQYPLRLRSATLIADKGKKAAWSIATNEGTKILKKSPATIKRLLFLIQAVKHMQKNGAPIPAMVATRSGKEYSEDSSGNCYVLSDAVQGTSPTYGTEDLLAIMKELGKFHLASRGFQSNFTTNEREHLGGWAQSYERYIERLESFKGLPKSSSNEFQKLFLLHADHFIAQGKEALKWIRSGYYTNWVNKVAMQKNLCHQDFAAANLIKTNKGLVVIDMDSLTYDLPARDIRKIFNKVMKKHGWSSVKAILMLRAYREVHPLSDEECQIIYADLLFPHLFYGITSKIFNKRSDWTQSFALQKFKSLIASENDRQKMLASWQSIVKQS
ncbi:CotS family spore coat protein [Paenibacillus alkaliterrae]|uniref:CotS family spore coat protein n=1 Tax=Paenibacillus alkaliterrae TaxID=320909 RepID=UPI001F41D97E|nr:CotS family spore coat protein [Paenibacillus alkaliterrae]MCF2939555.1 CotS family spore coat protein [Paenibacillus alkaliterrae]